MRSLMVVAAGLALSCGSVTEFIPNHEAGRLSSVAAASPSCALNEQCPSGSACTVLLTQTGTERRCLTGDPCDALQCPAETTCMAYLSSPAQFFCAYVSSG